MKSAAIITIGDELLYGSVVDTNAAYIGQRMTEAGIEPVCSMTVGDEGVRIGRALDVVCRQADVVLVTGGLGPTHDDVTKTVIAEAIGQDLVFHPDILDTVEAMFTRRGMAMPESNRIQAYMPRHAEVLDNPVGTAPGFMVRHHDAAVFVMPGVPREMKKMLNEQVLPRLKTHAAGRVILHRWIRTTGIGESSLTQIIGRVIEEAEDVKIASLPQETGVNLRLTAEGGSEEEARRRIEAVESRMVARAGEHIYGMDDDTLEEVIGRLLREAGATVAVAESCTGGLVASRMTDVPGSSDYLLEGVVSYSNAAKMARLEVPAGTIERHGAVSAETAAAMAQGVRRTSGATYGLSTTGVAGPGGGTPEKPVGLVYLGLAEADGVETRKLMLGPDRHVNKTRSALAALNLLRLALIRAAGRTERASGGN